VSQITPTFTQDGDGQRHPHLPGARVLADREARKVIMTGSAAEVMLRPERCSPVATAWSKECRVAIVDDWSTTGLGPRQSWPVALRVLVDTCLESEFPMQLAWGPDLLLVYNQAYIPLLGADKHPCALGRPAWEVWPDLFPNDVTRNCNAPVGQ